MNTPDIVVNEEKSNGKIENEIRKPRKGRKSKVKKPDFNLKIESKDVEIFFN